MAWILPALRSLLAVVAGYLVIALGTTLTFETWLGGIGYHESPPSELALATLGALLSGLAGGLVAAWIAGRRPLLHGSLVSIPLALDTTWVVTSGISDDPVWFDLGGGLTLMLGAALAGYLLERRRQEPRPAPATG